VDVPIRVLVLEDQIPDFKLTEQELRRSWPNAVCRRVDSEADFLDALGEEYDVVLGGYALPGLDAMRALELLREKRFDVSFIVIFGSGAAAAAASLDRPSPGR
jgi:DNA-binding NtrC family response regulator